MSTLKTKWFDFLRIKDFKRYFFMIIICLIVASTLGAFVPKFILELGANYGDKSQFHQSLEKLLYLFIFIYINRVFYQLTINKFIRNLVQNVRDHCYSKWLLRYDVQKNNEKDNDEFPLGEVMARIINDTEALRELLTSGTFGILIDLFFVISCLISFVTLNTVMGGGLMALEIIACVSLVWVSRYMRDIFLKVRTARGNVSRAVANVVGGVQETYFTNHGQYASKKCEGKFDYFLKIQLISNFWDSAYYSVAESLYPLLLASVILIFPYSGVTEAAILFALVDLIQRSIGPIKDIASKIANVQRALTGVNRINQFLDHLDQGDYADIKRKLKVSSQEGFTELDVYVEYFSYGKKAGQTVFELEDIKFKAKRGQLIGLVGLSGSGKSTLLGVIAGTIIPKDARLTLLSENGDRVTYPKKGPAQEVDYKDQVSLVSQDSHIFSETLEFNITLCSSENKKFEAFWKLMKEQVSYLASWDLALEGPLAPMELSIGQKQLISGLRACYHQKPLVLFDEISSGLDSELEKALRKMVLLVQKNSITMIVAHRLETIMAADCIHVMDNGRLVSSGNHRELTVSSPIYGKFMEELSHS